MDINVQMPELVTVVDVQFRGGGKSYYFDPGELTLEPGQEVIIDTQHGQEFGICQRGNHAVLADQVVQPLRPVIRLATEADHRRLEENAAREAQAFDTCQRFIERLALDMKLVRVEDAFDGSKLLFFFTSDGRVDFRELVKELAAIYRTRIEMRQIGVRDEAKLLGGLGICGRPFCCKQFLDDFQPVSIKMAKTQNLSLNPTKISGTCGRLMCCLKYEQDAYEDLLKHCPKQGSLVDTVDGRGTVVDVSLLRQQVKVSLEDAPDSVKYYRNEDIAVLRDGKGKKTDPPIPKDVAPISGDPERRAQLQHIAAQQEAAQERSYQSDWENFWALPEEAPEPVEPPDEEKSGERSHARRRRSGRRSGEKPRSDKLSAKVEKPATRSDKPAERPSREGGKAEKSGGKSAEKSAPRRRRGPRAHSDAQPRPEHRAEHKAEHRPEGAAGQGGSHRRRNHRGGHGRRPGSGQGNKPQEG